MRGNMQRRYPTSRKILAASLTTTYPDRKATYHNARSNQRPCGSVTYLLAEAADYLARTEPHSPTPYLVRRAIAWGSMSLEQLLPEMIRNGNELQEIFRLLQIR